MPPTSAYPARHILSSRPILPSTASSTLSTFLTQTSTSPHLHPDALLTSGGIQFSAHSGPTGGLALHHLQRIAAGLRGEILVQESREELEAQFADEMGVSASLSNSDDRVLDGAIGKRSRSLERVREWEDGGQDLESFGGQQREVVGDVGARDQAGEVEQDGEVPEIQTGADGKVDKAARNAAKKARRAKDRKEKLAEAKDD